MEKINNNSFESIKHIDEYGNEYWFARELQKILEYKEWRNFIIVIDKAKAACLNSNEIVEDHFVDVNKMVKIGSSTSRELNDYKLSRYACYLIAQNGDSRKKVIALAQTYFAVQTRKQELSETEYRLLSEDDKRFYQRNLPKKEIIHLIKLLKNLELKILIDFIMRDIKDYIMEKQLRILPKEKD